MTAGRLFEGADWDFSTLQRIHDACETIAWSELGLDTYANQIEVINPEQMLDAYSSRASPQSSHRFGVPKEIQYHLTRLPSRLRPLQKRGIDSARAYSRPNLMSAVRGKADSLCSVPTERTHSDIVSYPPRDTGAPILGFPSLHGSSRASSRRYTGKQVLLDDRVDAPIAIDHLRDAEIDSDGHKRNRLVFGQSLGAHQETTHFAKRIP